MTYSKDPVRQALKPVLNSTCPVCGITYPSKDCPLCRANEEIKSIRKDRLDMAERLGQAIMEHNEAIDKLNRRL